MATERADVLVLGAGIAGAAVALHLARARFGRVVVLDPRTPGAGATGRAAGIVTEQLWNRWDVEVVRESMREYAELAGRHDRSAYRVNGFVRWAAKGEAARALELAGETLQGWGVEVVPLTPEQVRTRLPAVATEGIRAAAFAPHDAVVAPSRIAELYVEEGRAEGVEFLLGAPVEAPRRSSSGRWSVESEGREWLATTVVVAAGAWSKRLFSAAGAPVPLAPYRTQAAILRPEPASPGDFPSFHDIDLDIYGRPEEAGRLLAGNGTEGVEADPESFVPGGDARFAAHLAEGFAARFPGWNDAALVRAWAGVCVATPDRRPVVGPLPQAPGLWALTGFNGFGVMRAGGVAGRLARALVAGEGSADGLAPLAPVLPGRFGGKADPFLPRPGFTLEGGDDPRF